MLRVDPAKGKLRVSSVRDLASELSPGDLVVVNDAGTLPASLRGRAQGGPIELRVRRALPGGIFEIVLFGPGDHRTRTEHRPRPRLPVGAKIDFGGGRLVAAVVGTGPHVHEVRFDRAGAELVLALHELGHPVQYAHVPSPLAIWDVQTAYAGRPWATEMPSAGRALSAEILLSLLSRGVGIAALTHAAGLSSVGDPVGDAEAPPAERYEIPERTVRAIHEARSRGGRVVAVGTTVARALEGSFAEHGALIAGEGETGWVLGPRSVLRLVDGLLTGLHEPGTSHYSLLSAFCDEALLARAWALAGALGMRSHELGDVMLVLPDAKLIPS